jgi:cell wall-associated NlpC family hydrolase
LYKVRFERFQTRAAAKARAAEVKDRGYIQDFFIVQPPAVAHGVDSDNALRSGIVRTARRFIGTPYRWGGESARSGFDCSGLTMTVYRLNGLDLPRTSRSQFRAGRHTPRQALRAGDLVFFSTGNKKQVSHVGIFSGKGQFIHASGKGRKIQTASLNNRYFQTRYMGARQYF